MDIILREDVLPSDDVMSQLTGLTHARFSGIRSALRKEGYEFEQVHRRGAWKVTKRPKDRLLWDGSTRALPVETVQAEPSEIEAISPVPADTTASSPTEESPVLDQKIEFQVSAEPISNEFEVVQYRIDALKSSFYNPPERTEQKRIENLVASIKTHGILVPVLITEDGQIVDGHRRVAAARQLEMTTVPAIVLPAGKLPDDVYLTINETTRKLGPSEFLHIELSGGKVPARQRQHINWLRKHVGPDALITLRSRRQSPDAMRRALSQIVSYCDRMKDKKFIRQAFEWLIHFGDMRLFIVSAMQGGIDAEMVEQAVMKGRRIGTIYEVK